MQTTSTLEEHYEQLLGLTPPWKVSRLNLDVEHLRIEIDVIWPPGEPAICPECGTSCAIKDHRDERTWRHLDTMQFQTLVRCRVPRSECPEHGVKTIRVPWAEAGSRFTQLFERFAIDVLLAARSVSQAQDLLRLSWDQVQAIQERAVERGLARRNLDSLQYVGLDEKSFGRGQDYISVLGDLPGGRILEVAPGRDEAAADALWQTLPESQRARLKAVAVDMWDPYMASTRQNVPTAVLVHDKFHVAKALTKAVDDVRKREHRNLLQENCETLKHTKYLWLRNPDHWTPKDEQRFKELKNAHLDVGRAWAIKEAFRDFWTYIYPGAARNFFRRWYFWATHSRLRPVIAAARTLQRHLTNLLTYLKHRITNAVVEGFNAKIQTLKSNARGFRSFDHYRIAILFHCGKLNLYPQ